MLGKNRFLLFLFLFFTVNVTNTTKLYGAQDGHDKSFLTHVEEGISDGLKGAVQILTLPAKGLLQKFARTGVGRWMRNRSFVRFILNDENDPIRLQKRLDDQIAGLQEIKAQHAALTMITEVLVVLREQENKVPAHQNNQLAVRVNRVHNEAKEQKLEQKEAKEIPLEEDAFYKKIIAMLKEKKQPETFFKRAEGIIHAVMGEGQEEHFDDKRMLMHCEDSIAQMSKQVDQTMHKKFSKSIFTVKALIFTWLILNGIFYATPCLNTYYAAYGRFWSPAGIWDFGKYLLTRFSSEISEYSKYLKESKEFSDTLKTEKWSEFKKYLQDSAKYQGFLTKPADFWAACKPVFETFDTLKSVFNQDFFETKQRVCMSFYASYVNNRALLNEFVSTFATK